jgi:NAD(P)-dependent dehydrogenase (short-subunit alcohol dehydrogenase family)
MAHSALQPGAVAAITGGASGIGLAAARALAALGLKVAIADLGAERLASAAEKIGGDLLTVETDVSDPVALVRFAGAVTERFGGADVVMNNAGIGPDSAILGPVEAWERILAVNLWGVIHGTRAFLPGMLDRGRPGLIINTGSKQGITTPPGNPAYNISKAGVKTYTEALQHDLRNRPGCTITAHLLIPGFVFTGLTAASGGEKPPAAWTAEQTVAFMLDKLEHGDFYILCPDNDVPRALDEKRIAWAAGDLIQNRPPLSRWHPDYADAFKAWAES